MMKKFSVFLCTFLLFLGVTGAANAIPFNLSIDFRSTDWAPANGMTSYTVSYPGFDVTATSNGTEANALYQDSIDGLGIMLDEGDEIDDFERLRVEFSTAQTLNGVWITDLFAYPDGNDPSGEMGLVKLFDDGQALLGAFPFIGNDADQANGELYVDFGGVADVLWANFFVVNSGDTNFKSVGGSCDNEFSVAGFTQPVPEPATMLLLGSGLLGLAGAGRKKFFKKNK